MSIVSVRSNIAQVQRRFKFAPIQVRHAARRALNRTGESVKTVAKKKLSVVIGVPQKKIAPTLDLKRANYSVLRAEVVARYKAFNVASFPGTRQLKRGGVSAKAWGKRKVYAKAFLMNKGRTAMLRIGPRRGEIRPLYGPIVPNSFRQYVVNRAMEDRAYTLFPRRFHHELRFAFRRIGVRID